MKKLLALFSSFVIGLHSFAIPPRSVDDKLLQTFKESFPNAEQVNWKELPETYVVNFFEEGIRSAIIYGKDGSFISSTRYYAERNLPYYILINIKKKYPGKQIFGVTEVSTPSGINYYIKMEDANVWNTFKIDSDGNLTLVEKLKKAPVK